jgi:hypothetical protein
MVSISSFGSTVSPETVTPETVYTSPSVMPAVMYMSLLVAADRDLGRIQAEVDVATVEVPGIELLDVAGQLLARVLVVALVPGQPVAGVRFPALGDVLLGEGLVADQVDVADLRGLAFLDVEGQVDAVAVELLHVGA